MTAPDFNALYGSKYLSAADIAKPTVVTIEAYEVVKFDRPGEKPSRKVALHLKDIEKAFICNKTNAAVLEGLYGQKFDAWLGRSFELCVENTLFAGKTVPALRAHPPKKPQPAGQRPLPPTPAGNAHELEDEIPF